LGISPNAIESTINLTNFGEDRAAVPLRHGWRSATMQR
jgi:hypothetical protein